MTILNIRGRAVALVAGYLGASLIAYAISDHYVALLLPAIGVVVDGILPRDIERTALEVILNQGQHLIALDTVLTHPLQIGDVPVPAGEAIDSTTLVAYALHHLAIIYAVLIAWPVRTVAIRIALLALGLPGVAISTLLDIPFVLAGSIHSLLLDAGAIDLAERGLAVYSEFLQRGGRIGVAITVAVGLALLCKAPDAARPRHEQPAAAT